MIWNLAVDLRSPKLLAEAKLAPEVAPFLPKLAIIEDLFNDNKTKTPEKIKDLCDRMVNFVKEDEENINLISELLFHYFLVRPKLRSTFFDIFLSVNEKIKINIESSVTFSRIKLKDNTLQYVLTKHGVIKSDSFKVDESKEAAFYNIYEVDSINEIMMNDDIDAFLNYVKDHPDFSLDTITLEQNSILKQVNHSSQVTLSAVPAFYGSRKIFEHLLINNRKKAKNCAPYACAGGDIRIINQLDKNSASFDDCLKPSIEFHRYVVTDWLLKTRRSMDASLSFCFSVYNFTAVYFYILRKQCILSPVICDSFFDKTIDVPTLQLLFQNCVEPKQVTLQVVTSIFKKCEDENRLLVLLNLVTSYKEESYLLSSFCNSSHFTLHVVEQLYKAGKKLHEFGSILVWLYQQDPKVDIIQYLIEKGAKCDTLVHLGSSVTNEFDNRQAKDFEEQNKKFLAEVESAHKALMKIPVSPISISPLYVACRNDNITPEIIKLMIDKGADPNVPFEQKSPLYAAFLRTKSRYEVIKILLEGGAKPDFTITLASKMHSTKVDCSTLLFFACCDPPSRLDLRIVELLLTHGANPNLSTSSTTMQTIFTRLCAESNVSADVIAMLIKHGASLESEGTIFYDGKMAIGPPLFIACAAKEINADIVKLMIESGADVNAKCSHDLTPFIALCKRESQNMELFQYVKKHGAEFAFNSGRVSLLANVGTPNLSIVKFIVESGVPFDKIDFPDTLLSNKLMNEEFLQYLIDHGFKLENRGKMLQKYFSGLYITNSLINVLLKNGVNINEKVGDDTYFTLVCANLKSTIEIIKNLIEKGADCKTRDVVGVATRNKLVTTDIIKLLMEKSGKTYKKEDYYTYIINMCNASNDNMAVYDFFLDLYGDINEVVNSHLLLCDICLSSNVTNKLFMHLVSKGADVTKSIPVEDGKGEMMSPIYACCKNLRPNIDILCYLLEKVSVPACCKPALQKLSEQVRDSFPSFTLAVRKHGIARATFTKWGATAAWGAPPPKPKGFGWGLQ